MTQSIGNAASVVGTWELLSIQFEFADTGECVDLYGPNPSGFLIFTNGGRLMGIVTAAGRAIPKTEADRAGLFESMMAYSGKYRAEGGNKFVTVVDVAWHPAWNERTNAVLCARRGCALYHYGSANYSAVPRSAGSRRFAVAKKLNRRRVDGESK